MCTSLFAVVFILLSWDVLASNFSTMIVWVAVKSVSNKLRYGRLSWQMLCAIPVLKVFLIERDNKGHVSWIEDTTKPKY